jgi:hypothetical protein
LGGGYTIKVPILRFFAKWGPYKKADPRCWLAPASRGGSAFFASLPRHPDRVGFQTGHNIKTALRKRKIREIFFVKRDTDTVERYK